MSIRYRSYQSQRDYQRMRTLLQELHLLKHDLSYGWHVARLDYAAYFILPHMRQISLEDTVFLWEEGERLIAFVVAGEGRQDVHFAVHPDAESETLEREMITVVEQHYSGSGSLEATKLRIWSPQANLLRVNTLIKQGYKQEGLPEKVWRRDLTLPMPAPELPEGYRFDLVNDALLTGRAYAASLTFRPADTSLAEVNAANTGWYHTLQQAPLYRRDLDLTVMAEDGSVAAFVTFWYDPHTQTAVIEPLGTVPEHQRKGLAKALLLEGMQKLKQMGCGYVFVGGYGADVNRLYEGVMGHDFEIHEPWVKSFDPRVKTEQAEEAEVAAAETEEVLPPVLVPV